MAIRDIAPEFRRSDDHSQIIIDTEGLFSGERQNKQTSCFNDNFDRAMVTFCFSVSHVVIVNIKGDLTPETRDLLGVCGWALNKLQLPQSQRPKIHIVLNQQADPNTENHKKVLQDTIQKLNELYDLGGEYGEDDIKFQDIIDLNEGNFTILPTAFDSKNLNDANSQIYDF